MLKKALIVDDTPLDVELTRRVLDGATCDFDVTVVADGAEALLTLAAGSFDVILLDLKLPKVDGFEILKQISSKPFLSDVPVIVLSNSGNHADRVRTRAMGAREFVEKSVDYYLFKENLTHALRQDGFTS